MNINYIPSIGGFTQHSEKEKKERERKNKKYLCKLSVEPGIN